MYNDVVSQLLICEIYKYSYKCLKNINKGINILLKNN